METNFCILAVEINSWTCLLLTDTSTLKILTHKLLRVWMHSVNLFTLWLQLIIFFLYSKKCFLMDTFKLLSNHSFKNDKFYIQTVKFIFYWFVFRMAKSSLKTTNISFNTTFWRAPCLLLLWAQLRYTIK